MTGVDPQHTLPRWQALLLPPLGGALITLSFAPFRLWPLAILGCAFFAYLLAGCSARQAVWRGWLFGLGLFGSGASWVYVSIHVYGNAGVGLAVLLTVLFCAGLGLLYALQAWVYVRFVRPLPGGMLVGFAALWVLGEWLRSWLLTGFPGSISAMRTSTPGSPAGRRSPGCTACRSASPCAEAACSSAGAAASPPPWSATAASSPRCGWAA